MHGKHRDAQIYPVYIQVGDIFGHGSAAAAVHLAQLAGLPHDVVGFQQTADFSHKLRGSVGGIVFSSVAGILCDNHAVIQEAAVIGFIHTGVAVSYTHLDVYKRQVYTSAGINELLLAGEKRMAFGANFNANILFCGAGSDYTVSYTHLEVYKRQLFR